MGWQGSVRSTAGMFVSDEALLPDVRVCEARRRWWPPHALWWPGQVASRDPAA